MAFFFHVQKGKAAEHLALISLVLLLFDLVPFMKTYHHIVVQKPFVKADTVYPNVDPVLEKMDIKNFRVNRPRVFLGISPEEQYTNFYTVYDVRSYGGADSDIPPYLDRMIKYFHGSSMTSVIAFAPVSRDQRFLDIFGVAYDVNENNQRETRAGALSRFMLFTNYEVIEDDEEMLARLKDPNLNPTDTLVLDKAPAFPPNTVSKTSLKVNYESEKTSEITLDIEAPFPSVLFFGDSYHSGWQATVNGRPAELLRANYNFMAIELAKGESKVLFEFKPRTFLIGKKLSLLGGILLFGFLIFLATDEVKFRRKSKGASAAT